MMNKLDKAIEVLQGNYDNAAPVSGGVGDWLWKTGSKRYQGVNNSSKEWFGEYICTRAEFEARAKELGWVNGYKWGKEYQCDGKKPDLPGDVIIQVKAECLGKRWSDQSVAEGWGWSAIHKFRIVDERYKPVEPQTQATDWHQRGEFPPVGVECEYGPYWHACEIVAYHKGLAVVWDAHDLEYFRTNKPEIFRPIKTERERFIENAGACLANNFTLVSDDILEVLFDAGFKAPEDKK